MTDQDYNFIRRLLKERSAVDLDDTKQYLVESRLAPILRQQKLASVADLVGALVRKPDNALITQIIEAMVTTETSLFRDFHPFETLRTTVLPELIRLRRDQRRLKIWCAASSSGQEPYSLALLIREHFPELSGWKVSLLATDISGEMLARCREGVYNQIEANRGLPAALQVKYFEQHGTKWQLSADVRRMVDFQELNLSRPWPVLPPLDLILLRNVLIYFDLAMKKEILGKMARLLKRDGYLLLGGAETTFNLLDSFERVANLKAGFFRLVK